MDKIAIISDVHGNLTALNAVLKDIDLKGISKIYCLGDSVIKCANPDKVVDILRNRCEVILRVIVMKLFANPMFNLVGSGVEILLVKKELILFITFLFHMNFI